jgi:hypothetical protein
LMITSRIEEVARVILDIMKVNNCTLNVTCSLHYGAYYGRSVIFARR